MGGSIDTQNTNARRTATLKLPKAIALLRLNESAHILSVIRPCRHCPMVPVAHLTYLVGEP